MEEINLNLARNVQLIKLAFRIALTQKDVVFDMLDYEDMKTLYLALGGRPLPR